MRNFNKYFSPKVYAAFIMCKINLGLLHHIEAIVLPSFREPLPFHPIFIIGAPRSGSTLLYQLLSDAFDMAYMSNFHCHFFGAPALAEKLFNPLKHKQPSDYRSFHGGTNGLTEPSECGEWWYRFFRREPAYVTLADVDPHKMKHFRRSLVAFAKAAGKPLLFKNLYATIRLEAIAKYVPESLFIVVKRDLFYNAVSILAGRKKVFGDYNQWWSVPPPNVEQLKKLPVCQQVVGQIRSIYGEIERAISQGFIHPDRLLRVEYEELCRDTHGVVRQIETFLCDHGIHVSRRFKIPKTFSIARDVNIDQALANELYRLTKND